MKTVILANGSYPVHPVPLRYLEEADLIVCCDGAAEKLVAAGKQPGAIVGDLDSVSPQLRKKHQDILFADPEQETNDLTKAVRWCIARGIDEVKIVGATGIREDHTLANISLLADYNMNIKVVMLTDTGFFEVYYNSVTLDSFRGQQVSLFSVDPAMRVTSSGLRYPLHDLPLVSWWRGTLNESDGNTFTLHFKGGSLIVFREYGPSGLLNF